VQEGFDIIANNEIHLIIADQRMPKMTGAMFLAKMAKMAKEYPRIARIIITGYSDIDAVVEAINKGRVYHYVSKPWDSTQFKVVIDNALEVFWLKTDND
jgi:response regulator RpfG family c-di-GMP phosphodiesterase